jgi:uncharacterized protein
MEGLIARHSAPLVRDLLAHTPGVVLEGARQVGKSTLAAAIGGVEAVHANLDHEATRSAAELDPEAFVAQAGDRLLLIDEIQRAPRLTLALKAAIDADRRPGRFLVTGSSSLLRVRGTADSLAGRVSRVTLHGLSRGELRGRLDDFASVVRSEPNVLAAVRDECSRSAYVGLVAEGAYPELHRLPERLRTRWLDDYLQGIVGRDMAELRRTVDPTRATALLRALAGRQAGELVQATLARDTGIPTRTITGYLDLLHDVGLITSIPPWTRNLTKREIGRPKTIVPDAALAMRLARVTVDQLRMLEYGEAFGAMLEGFVAAELLRQRTWSARGFELFHYRDRAGLEADLILEYEDGGIVAIEVKASTSFATGHFTNLVALRDRLGARFVAGVVLNTGSAGRRFSDRLYGAPVSALWRV